MTRKRSRLWRALSIAALFYAFVAPARADLQAGIDAHKRGDYVATLKEIGPLAKRGNPTAQYLLAVMLVKGSGVAKDSVMALAWLTCATAKREDGGALSPAQTVAPAQPMDKAQKQALLTQKQAIKLRDSVTKQLPVELADKARRIAKGCKTVAARAKVEEEAHRNFYRYGLLERIFFFAGDTIIIGLLVVAGQAGMAGFK